MTLDVRLPGFYRRTDLQRRRKRKVRWQKREAKASESKQYLNAAASRKKKEVVACFHILFLHNNPQWAWTWHYV